MFVYLENWNSVEIMNQKNQKKNSTHLALQYIINSCVIGIGDNVISS